ncbi:MAG: DJ-1/PfpI family protein [Rhodothalassiaceae bacterium]
MTAAAFRIAFLIYPGMTQLDFTGPAEVLARMPGAECALVWKTLDPVASEGVIRILPTATMDTETRYDMICVPGGWGCTDIMADDAVLDWLRRQGETAELITSVCTGSLILAAAGLLTGYKAGCHWAWAEQLRHFGAEPVRQRVVIDRDRITAGGVTAGIDFAFTIIERRCGRDVAEAIQLGLEYDPAPLSGGTPETARPEITERVTAMLESRLAERREAIAAIAATAGA